MKSLYLYTTLGCHLCEQAKVVAWPLLAEFDYRLKEVEISDSEILMKAYGVRIPVLAVEGDDQGLGWPFDDAQLRSYLQQAEPSFHQS